MRTICNVPMAVVVGLAVAGCATVTRGTVNDVNFISEPPGALVTLSIGQSCVAPCVLKVPRKDSFSATFTLEGHEPQVVFVNTVVQGGGAAGVVGNALVGGIVGVGVDVASGAANDHSPNPVSVVMRKPSAAAAQRPARGR
jgi:hypothetical protein